MSTETCKDCGSPIWQEIDKAVATGEYAVVWTNEHNGWVCPVTGNEHVPGEYVETDDTWKVTYAERPAWWGDPTEPRCDVCGVHQEEADVWDGECGNCGEHCTCSPMDPREALTYAILAINTDQAPDATSGNDLLYLEVNAERALAALDRIRDYIIASGEDLPDYVFGKGE